MSLANLLSVRLTFVWCLNLENLEALLTLAVRHQSPMDACKTCTSAAAKDFLTPIAKSGSGISLKYAPPPHGSTRLPNARLLIGSS